MVLGKARVISYAELEAARTYRTKEAAAKTIGRQLSEVESAREMDKKQIHLNPLPRQCRLLKH